MQQPTLHRFPHEGFAAPEEELTVGTRDEHGRWIKRHKEEDDEDESRNLNPKP